MFVGGAISMGWRLASVGYAVLWGWYGGGGGRFGKDWGFWNCPRFVATTVVAAGAATITPPSAGLLSGAPNPQLQRNIYNTTTMGITTPTIILMTITATIQPARVLISSQSDVLHVSLTESQHSLGAQSPSESHDLPTQLEEQKPISYIFPYNNKRHRNSCNQNGYCRKVL